MGHFISFGVYIGLPGIDLLVNRQRPVHGDGKSIESDQHIVKNYGTCITANKSLNSRPMSKTDGGNTGHVARNQTSGAAPTCGDVRASSSFIEKVTGKGGRTDDEEARGQGGHHPQKQQDCPEAAVNWKPKTKEENVSPQWSRLSRRGVCSSLV